MQDNNKRLANRRAKAEAKATPRQRSELARRKAMGTALVLSPLKFLKARSPNCNRTKTAVFSASIGCGYYVQFAALRLANAA